jgi:hypothetical protein
VRELQNLIALVLMTVCLGSPQASPAGAERGIGVPASDGVRGSAGTKSPEQEQEIDAFMKQVLDRRDENWKKLQQYILDEREKIEVRGPAGLPLWGHRREYQWFIREGYFIRSPLTADGVSVPEEDRRKYEDAYLRRVKARDKKPGEKTAAEESGSSISIGPSGVDVLLQQTGRPQFVDSAYFMKFKFDNGRYALIGREKLGDAEVLRIEYYPTKLFNDEPREGREGRVEKVEKPDERKAEQQKKGQEFGKAIDKLMNKNSKVTLWVEPKTKQIVKYVFDNVKMDFLPAAWLLSMEELKASMSMNQPFPANKDIWLPKNVEMYFSAMLAIGMVDVRFNLDYHDYREATTSAKIKGRGGWQ